VAYLFYAFTSVVFGAINSKTDLATVNFFNWCFFANFESKCLLKWYKKEIYLYLLKVSKNALNKRIINSKKFFGQI